MSPQNFQPTIIGAIIGDTIGSIYEFDNIKTTDFYMFNPRMSYTDDSIMTIAVADWILHDTSLSAEKLIETMQTYGRNFPCPMGGYGGRFSGWLNSNLPQPYKSWGNGSAMRASAVGFAFDSLEKTLDAAKRSAEVTHNHPEGIKGAQATAAAIFMARNGKSKSEIRDYISDAFDYDLARTCDDIRLAYTFNESCQDTVPEAIIAFLDSADFESAIRLAVSLGGDSDTLACITGGIAAAFYGEIPENLLNFVVAKLPKDFLKILNEFNKKYGYNKMETQQNQRITPAQIRTLQENEIFVFGSNLRGAHGGGAAHAAVCYFGAVWGQGVGLQGQSYAIPTMQGGVETIQPYVDEFITFAKEHKELKFLVTPIGCGIAGFSFEEMAPLFMDAVSVENIYLPRGFWKILG